MINRLEFLMEHEFSSVETVRKKVRAALLESFPGASAEKAADDFCQAVSELLNNAVKHGGGSEIRAELLLERDRATFRLVTDGIQFDPFSGNAVMPEVDKDGHLPSGGFGLAIIRVLADNMNYEYRNGKNITEISKVFQGG